MTTVERLTAYLSGVFAGILADAPIEVSGVDMKINLEGVETVARTVERIVLEGLKESETT